MSKDWPVYFEKGWEDPVAKAQQKYFGTEKGKAARRKAQKPSVKRYLGSPKGKAALKKHYDEKVKPQRLIAKACADWMAQNPGKTAADFLQTLQASGLSSKEVQINE